MKSIFVPVLAAMLVLSLWMARAQAAGDDASRTGPAIAAYGTGDGAAGDDSAAADGAADDSSTASSDDSSDDGSDGSTMTAEAPAVPVPSSPDSSPVERQALITMNFQDVDIPVLAKFISEITGRNFVVDESVRGKVSIISPTKVTPEQAYSIFQSVLQVKGFTTVQAGPVIKIVPAREVRESAPITTTQRQSGDAYVTRMVKLKNIEAASVVPVIQPMVSHDGLVAAFPEDNTLIVTDDAYNVDRLMKIIGSLDVEGTKQNIEVIPLKLAFAGQLAPEIEQIIGNKGGGTSGTSGYMRRPGFGVVAPSAQSSGTEFKIIPDERTNSLVVLAGPLQMRQIKELVTKLDIQPPNATAKIHVYHLKNAQALEMVQVLGGLLGGSGAGQLSPTTGRDSLGRGSSLGMFSGGSFGGGFGGGLANSGYGGEMGGMGMGGMGGMSGMGMGGMGMGSPLSNRGSASNVGVASVSTGGSSGGTGTTDKMSGVFENPVSITADPATNSLVVSASPQDYATLHNITTQLDTPRVQVFVQAVIVEVSTNRMRDIGVNFYGGTGGVGTIGVGSLNFGQLQNALANPLGLTGLGVGLASGKQCSIPSTLNNGISTTGTGTTTTTTNITVPCDLALITALEQDTHSNVLSAPTLLTADNVEAMIVVGENLPFVGSSTANAGLPNAIFNSVDRQNVGITLDIVPQVSEGDYVKLDLYEEVSNVVPGTANQVTNPLGPTTTLRSASTTVMVMDHRTAVIGGLLSDDLETATQGVPFLSDIPVIGNLFSDRNHTYQKQNLLVFLTPHIIRTREDLRALALSERQAMINALGRKEMHEMPKMQIDQLSKPNFSISVPPRDTLPAPYNSNGTTITPPGAYQQAPGYPPPGGAGGYYGPTTMNAPAAMYNSSSTTTTTSSGYTANLGTSAYRSSSSTTTYTPPGVAAAPPSAAPLDSGAGARPHF